MISPASSIRVERVIQECMVRHPAHSHLAMRLAYEKVFVDVLRRIPRRDLPRDPFRVAVMVRALQFASFAAFAEHATGKYVAFPGEAADEVCDWMEECSRFWVSVLQHWNDLKATVSGADERRQLLSDTHAWLMNAIGHVRASISRLQEDERLTLSTAWFQQIEGVSIALATFWLNKVAAATLHEILEKDSYELHQFQYLYNLQGDDEKGM